MRFLHLVAERTDDEGVLLQDTHAEWLPCAKMKGFRMKRAGGRQAGPIARIARIAKGCTSVV